MAGSAGASGLDGTTEEIVDEVDACDRFVRRTTRARVRRENLWHRCTWIFVHNAAGAVFLHQRTTTKDLYPGYWDVAVGGVLAAGEGYDEGARRELAEELGIDRDPGAAVAEVRYEDDVNRVLGRAYVCRWDGEVVLQPEEVQRGEWVSPERIVDVVSARRFCPDGLRALAAVLERNGLVSDEHKRSKLLAWLLSAS